jgi:hypothetical protein
VAAKKEDSPATKADLGSLRTEFKSDLKNEIGALRTELKGEMESLRTEVKSDMQALRTELKGDNQALRAELKGDNQALKTELKGDNQALKTELKGDIHRLSGAIIELQADMREVKSNMATKADVDRIMSAIDSFAKRSENDNRAMVLHGQTLTEVEVKLGDHEKRLARLESIPK